MQYFEDEKGLLRRVDFWSRKFLAKKPLQICCFGKYCLYLSSNREMEIGYFKFYRPWKAGNTRTNWR